MIRRTPPPRRPLTGLVLALAMAGCGPPAPGSSGPPTTEAQACAPVIGARAGAVVVAGSGSNLALARRVVAARGLAAEVPPSIGTAGAVAALADGAIDVGLASRPLTPDERGRGLRSVAWASCPFGPVARRGELRAMQPESLVRRIAGGRGVVFLRERGDSGQALLRSWSPEIATALDAALADGRWPVLTTDQEMRDAVETTPGAIGFLDSSTLGPDLELLPGSPLRKELTLLLGPKASSAAEAFVQAATSPAAAPVIEAAGCTPR